MASRIVPFEPWHVRLLEGRKAERESTYDIGWQAHQVGNYPGLTLVVADKPIACAGLVTMWPGVAEAWAYLSPAVEHRAVALHRQVKRALLMGERHLNLHRIQAAVRCDFVVGYRWLERLGFEPEGLMHKYGPRKESYMRFARVR